MRMQISTWNVNGLRSSVASGLEQWLYAVNSDVVCLQEVKAQEDLLGSVWFRGYAAHWSGAERRGYSGVVTLVSSAISANSVTKGIGQHSVDSEGRVLSVEFDQLEIINVYAPHSHRQLRRLEFKLFFLDHLVEYVGKRKRRGKPLVIVGDLNVAHTEKDLSNPSANKKNAGFLPEERGRLDRILKDGFVDAFRFFCDEPGHYTWWSPIKGVRERNVGWRLDYILVDATLTSRLRACFHSPEQMGSDHCPVTAVLDI
jgi:exodeoxyribonuclease III